MRIVFRTEGNHRQGMGDLWGSLVLANACVSSGHEPLVIIAGGAEAVALLEEHRQRYAIADSLEQERQVLLAFRPDVIVVNKLKNEADYIRWLKQFTALVVTMDDDGEAAGMADLRVNVLYPILSAVTDLRYLALRDEYQAMANRARSIHDDVQELLITQGGSDTYGVTPPVIRGLDGMAIHPHVTVVLGPAFRHHRELQQVVVASSLNLSVVQDPPNLLELMWQADLAITAGGLMMFELACVGTPSLVVCGECFELPTAQRLEEAGVVRLLGFRAELDERELLRAVEGLASDVTARRAMSEHGRRLVDGRGCERMIELIEERLAHTVQSR